MNDRPKHSPAPGICAPQLPPLAGGWCFFLDIDGTLLEFAERPDAVCVDSKLTTLLSRLQQASGGAVALISGRSIVDIDRLFYPLHFAVAGQHGIERRNHAGTYLAYATAAAYLPAEIEAVKRLVAQHKGLLLENKGATLAVHYRLAPQFRRRVKGLMQALRDSVDGKFELQAGNMVIEIKPGGRDKGTAIEEFMEESPFRGRVPVFIGDDLADEHGFALVNRRRGHSVKVGGGTSVARWRLPDAPAVRRWLGEYVEHYLNRGNP